VVQERARSQAGERLKSCLTGCSKSLIAGNQPGLSWLPPLVRWHG
jgi:hypothetical protein